MLFEPYTFSGLRLKNRIVRSATYEKLADPDGRVTDGLIDLYEALAEGGSGLIITGSALVHPSGRYRARMISVHADIYIDGLRRLTEAVHRLHGILALQLAHGGRHCRPLLLGGQDSLAPSALYNPVTKTTPRAMTDSEIWEVVDAFANAAWRARAAGFDAVQIHAAHGGLISSFLSPVTNKRDDYWGGDEERRFHLAEEVCNAVRESVGRDYPVIVKLNADDLVEGGLRQEESARIAQRLQHIGLDALEIGGGLTETKLDVPRPEEEAYFRPAARLFKSKLTIPVILTGGMRSGETMEDVLAKKEADLIGLSRPLIREPNLPNLLREGKEKSDCISCDKCSRFDKMRYVRCKQIRED